MNLGERIKKGKFGFMHVYIYDSCGNEICHVQYKPYQINIFENIVYGESYDSDLEIELGGDIRHDEMYDSYEFTHKGNEYMIMFS